MGWIADILKEIPSAARYKSELEISNRKIGNFERKIITLEQKIITLESENHNLRQEIQRRDDIIQKEKPHTNLLDKEKSNILLHLHNKPAGLFTFQMIQTIDLSETIANYHLQELLKTNFVRQGLPDKPGRPWHITDKGTKYLIENKLIT